MTKFGKRISGQALVEHLVLWPALVLVTMSLIQAGFLYRGKTTLEHATFMAAREGSLQHAFKAPMKKTLAQGMAPLDVRANPGTGTYVIAAGAAGVPGTTYAKHFHLTKAAGGADITVISPSRSAFNQFAREQYILCTDDNSCRNGNVVEKTQRMRQIPNDNLSVRPATTHSVSVQGGSASLNLQDANLLKIRSHWCFGLEVPIVNAALYRTLTALGTLTAEQRSCIARTEAARALGQTTYYIPLSASSIVRMQSAVRCEDSSCSNLGTGGVLAGTGSGGPGGTPGSGNPGTGNPGSHPPGNGNPGSGNNPGGGTTNPPPTDPVPLCTPEENSEPVATTPSEDSGVLGDIWDALKDMAGTAQDFIR
ncbi:MAG: pilus assembly protein, partial [Rhodocyclaceae bacterium]|nr:pilus assembly protein [Rhodocyclaceae bacterium]